MNETKFLEALQAAEDFVAISSWDEAALQLQPIPPALAGHHRYLGVVLRCLAAKNQWAAGHNLIQSITPESPLEHRMAAFEFLTDYLQTSIAAFRECQAHLDSLMPEAIEQLEVREHVQKMKLN